MRLITKVASTKVAGAVGKKVGGKEHGEVIGWLFEQATSVAMQVTEEADKRIWSTLPGQIEVARIWLEPGTYTLSLSFHGGGKAEIAGVTVNAGKRSFVTYRTVP